MECPLPGEIFEDRLVIASGWHTDDIIAVMSLNQSKPYYRVDEIPDVGKGQRFTHTFNNIVPAAQFFDEQFGLWGGEETNMIHYPEDKNPYDEDTTNLIIKEVLTILDRLPDISVDNLQDEIIFEVYHQRYLDDQRSFYDEEYGFIAGICHMAKFVHDLKRNNG